MAPGQHIILIESDAAIREQILAELRRAGMDAAVFVSRAAGLAEVHEQEPGLLIVGPSVPLAECIQVLGELKGAPATGEIRIVRISPAGAEYQLLDQRADDVVTLDAAPGELLARLRAQMRARAEIEQWKEKSQRAEEGQRIAHTAFQALAVTEKMTADAFHLGRSMKLGLAALLVLAAIMSGVFFLYSRRAEKETRRAYSVIMQLEQGISTEKDLMERARRTREELERTAKNAIEENRQRLEQKTQELSAAMSQAQSGEVAALQKQLTQTRTQLQRLETEGRVAQGIIRSYAPSVCLLHVVVAFRESASGKRLRYAGVAPDGEVLKDSEGNPIFGTEGRGPEVRADFFGTGFLVNRDGRVLTNRHVVQPWWKNDELAAIARDGFEPVLAEMNLYFPDSPGAHRAEVKKISPDVDLAVVQTELGSVRRAVLALDGRREASVSGQPVVLMGYATGIDAILARAGEETLRSIVEATNGNPSAIMAELARRRLIRPLTTQGHVGDVLADKIVYDAQTTSGGSGGPVFNIQGKVIGVNYAVVRGFGGSNFGIPIRYAESLLR